MDSFVVVDPGDVAVVTLNRPEKRNALSIELRRELATTFGRVGADPSISVMILTGAGNAFCAGMDTAQFGGDDANRRSLYESTVELFDSLAALPIPAIAAVNGAALGGGFALAAGCDVRIAGTNATFGLPEIRMGIPASYAAMLRTVPDQVARELAFTGRIVGADQALALGIVREVHGDVVARARALGEEMAIHGRPVLEATKRLVAAGNGDPGRASAAEMDLFRRAMIGDE